VTIAADDVLMRGDQRLGALLIVRGGAVSVLDVANRDEVTIKDAVQLYGDCAGVQYGLSISRSTDVQIKDVTAFSTGGYGAAGILIAEIPVAGRVRMTSSNSSSAPRGILIRDCPFGSRVVLRRNFIGAAMPVPVTDGVVLSNSDGVLLTRTGFDFNVQGTGILVDATSDDNRILGNQLTPTGGPNAVDDGSGNCWRRNNCADATCPGPEGCP
jgi:hypothetical protein